MQIGRAQSARKGTAKGPRALGLVQLAANGKAHLIPITILIDGKFYDASAYKADPVPFALTSEVVYEAVRTGVSKGLFTVTSALQGHNTWLGEGTWLPAGSAPAKKAHTDEKPKLEDDSGPPRLRKAEGAKGEPQAAPPPQTAPASSAPPATTAPATTPTPEAGSAGAPQAPAPAASDNDTDPNRPTLRRGKSQPASATVAAAAGSGSRPGAAAASGTKGKSAGKDSDAIQLIPAISDAHGPDPRPYAFEMKPEEEQSYRKKMLALAISEVQEKARQMTPVLPGATPTKRPPARPGAKAAVPTFDDIQFHAFDLWNTNEPVFVMSAQAHLPASASSSAEGPRTFFLTLVAKADIYLDLHKLLSDVTDQQHLDEFPKLELIDAVDADGDGRGELLFREISDAGTAWAVYRAAADRLFPLFEGTPTKAAVIP